MICSCDEPLRPDALLDQPYVVLPFYVDIAAGLRLESKFPALVLFPNIRMTRKTVTLTAS